MLRRALAAGLLLVLPIGRAAADELVVVSRGDDDFEVVTADSQRLSSDEFYRRVGRPDLARKYLDLHRTRSQRFIWGGVLLAGGALLALAGMSTHEEPCWLLGTCVTTTFDEGLELGAAVTAGVGLIMTLAALPVPHQPISSWEARQLARAYSQRQVFGVAPVVTHDQVGLAFAVSF
jgi:hypothetical protein